MSEGSQEQPKLTRRQFLGKMVAAGAGLVIGGGPLIAGLQQKLKETTQLPSFQPAPQAPQTKSEETKREFPNWNMEVPQDRARFDVSLSEELSEINNRVVNPLEKSIEEQLKYLRKEISYQESAKRVLNWEKLIRETAEYLRKIKGTNFISNEVEELLSPLIYVESRGKEKARNNKTNASGLCQILPGVGEKIVKHTDASLFKRMFINTKNFNLFDAETNITLSFLHLSRLSYVFPQINLALWSYHLGEQNLVGAIEVYLVQDFGVSQKEVDRVLAKKDEPGTRELVKKYSLNFSKIISSENVKNFLIKEDAFNDDTHLYVPRVLAARNLLQEQK